MLQTYAIIHYANFYVKKDPKQSIFRNSFVSISFGFWVYQSETPLVGGGGLKDRGWRGGGLTKIPLIKVCAFVKMNIFAKFQISIFISKKS